jgi:dTDP-4-dehydrorhamnose 3,5-epimerase
MKIIQRIFGDVLVLESKIFNDNRGYFFELHNKNKFEEINLSEDFIQDNLSYNAKSGTLRGLHFQLPPYDQGKLVSVISGAICDVVVDIRKESKSYGQFCKINLEAASGKSIWIPAGFAHGFMTIVDQTIVMYKVTKSYSPLHSRGISWDDSGIGIDWPNISPILSDQDKNWPNFSVALKELK